MKGVRGHGFTLVEVVVAIGLLAGLAAAVSSFVWNLTSTRRGVEAVVEEELILSSLFDQLESDLASVVAGGRTRDSGIVGSAESLHLSTRRLGIPTDPAGGEAQSRGQLSDLRSAQYVAAEGRVTVKRLLGVGGGNLGEDSGAMGAVRFRYYDGTRWATEFDSSKGGGLPVAVEVRVWRSTSGAIEFVDEKPSRRADRVRVIAVPDGPGAGWKEGTS